MTEDWTGRQRKYNRCFLSFADLHRELILPLSGGCTWMWWWSWPCASSSRRGFRGKGTAESGGSFLTRSGCLFPPQKVKRLLVLASALNMKMKLHISLLSAYLQQNKQRAIYQPPRCVALVDMCNRWFIPIPITYDQRRWGVAKNSCCDIFFRTWESVSPEPSLSQPLPKSDRLPFLRVKIGPEGAWSRVAFWGNDVTQWSL